MIFRALITIIAKFDLETIQIDVINAFINSKLNEMIYMRQSSGFEKNKDTVLQLKKVLYGLRRSFLL